MDYDAWKLDEGEPPTININTVCPRCKKEYPLTVPTKNYQKWIDGMAIQNAFPYMSIDDRERIKTGYCPPCWDKF